MKKIIKAALAANSASVIRALPSGLKELPGDWFRLMTACCWKTALFTRNENCMLMVDCPE
jgi:hypothetical protein